MQWAKWSSPLTLIYSQRFITLSNESGEMAALRATPHHTTAMLQQITSRAPLTTHLQTDRDLSPSIISLCVRLLPLNFSLLFPPHVFCVLNHV